MADIVADIPPVGNWFRYLWERGYRRLCPVVPPGAELDPESSIARRGKTDPRGKVPGMLRSNNLWSGFDFTRYDPVEADLDRWYRMKASVGIKTGHGLLGLDIDVMNEPVAKQIVKLAKEYLGDAPIRYGRYPKAMLVYRITEDMPYGRVTFTTATEQRAAVELLGEGRQFVAMGLHPATLELYRWHGLRPRPSLPETTPERVEAFMEALAERMPNARSTLHTEPLDWRDQTKLRGEPGIIADAINNLPNRNDDFPDRDSYIALGYAIKGAMGPEYQDEGLDLFLQWSARWDGGENDETEARSEWKRMVPPFRSGAPTIYWHAERAGWTGRSKLFFQPITGEVDLEAAGWPSHHTHAALTPHSDKLKRFEMLNLGAIMNMPDPTFMVDRHIPETGLGFLYSRPGAGKSFICLDLSLAIAYGLPTWHGDALRVRPNANVLYIAREGSSGFKARIRAWQKGRELPETANFHMIRETINFVLEADINALVRTVREADLGPLDLIVVDTVSRAIPGADENLQKDMSTFVAACDALVETFHCVVLGVHHAGKSGDLRGSTVLRGAGDFVFRLDREPESRTGRLWCEKQKDAPDGWAETYRFVTVDLGDGQSSLVPHRVSIEEDEALADGAEDKVLAAIGEAWEAGRPWSREPRTASSKSGRVVRYGPLLASKILGLGAVECEEIIDELSRMGRIEYAHLSSKVSGWKVICGTDSPGELFE